jgi:glycine/D-amino acid oxidase-like deaminating enzyme
MAEFSARSIELMEELARDSKDFFKLRFSGYDFVSESPGREIFPPEQQPAGVGRSDWPHGRPGLVRVSDKELIKRSFPWLSPAVSQVVQIHRAGSIDVYALGALLLKRARQAGVELLRREVSRIRPRDSGGFELRLERNGISDRLFTNELVLAAGPFNNALASMLGIGLPVLNFLQRKMIIRDVLGIIPREMPFTVFADPQELAWQDSEREMLAGDEDLCWLLDEFPPGLHIKPESRDQIKLGWAYNRCPEEPRWQPGDDPLFPDVVLRGACRFIPALEAYLEKMPTPVVQMAGYYSRTPENWPLIGPLEVEGLFTVAALSGFGTMTACAAGELCAAWIAGGPRPGYARYFHPGRYSDPGIVKEISKLDKDGQL